MPESSWPSELQVARNHDSWRQAAYAFKHAAEILSEALLDAGRQLEGTVGQQITEEHTRWLRALGVQLPSLVLMGYSLENLLKGLLVKKNPNVISEGKRIPFATHELTVLWRQAGLEAVTEDEEWFLALLTRTIVADKYPSPLSPANLPFPDVPETSAHTVRSQRELLLFFERTFGLIDGQYRD